MKTDDGHDCEISDVGDQIPEQYGNEKSVRVGQKGEKLLRSGVILEQGSYWGRGDWSGLVRIKAPGRLLAVGEIDRGNKSLRVKRLLN